MGEGEGHTLSNRGYSQDSLVDVQALFYLCINQLALKWRGGFTDQIQKQVDFSTMAFVAKIS